MEELPADVIERMTMELPIKDLLNLCLSQSRGGGVRKLCQNDQFWMRRFEKDFSKLFKKLDKNRNWKQAYLFVVSEIGKASQDAVNYIYSTFGSKEKFLRDSYLPHLEDFFDDLFVESIDWYLRHLPYVRDRVSHYYLDWISFYIYDISNNVIIDTYYADNYDWQGDLADIFGDGFGNIAEHFDL